MTVLLRLYPRAWRDRYGEELERLLEDRPPGFLGTIDLVRGALDARLHASLVPATAGGGPAPTAGDLPAARRSFPWAAFLGTLAAALYLLSGTMVIAQGSLPWLIGAELAGTFLVIGNVTLGLAVLAGTGRGIIAKLAGIAFVSSVVALWWTGAWLPAYLPLLGGSVLLGIGSVVERQPARSVGGLATGLSLALWVSYDGGDLLGVVIAAYAIVAVGLAWPGRRGARPIVVGLAGAAILAGIIVTSTMATSSVKIHDGFGVQCGEMETGACLTAIDGVTIRLRTLLPDDRMVWGSVDEGGVAQVCTAKAPAADGAEGRYDARWLEGLDEAAIGLRVTGGAARGGDELHYVEICWAAIG